MISRIEFLRLEVHIFRDFYCNPNELICRFFSLMSTSVPTGSFCVFIELHFTFVKKVIQMCDGFTGGHYQVVVRDLAFEKCRKHIHRAFGFTT
jgi:hypothetical protein